MNQEHLFKPVPRTKLQTLSQEELIEFIGLQQKVNDAFQREVERLRAENDELEQKSFYIDEQYITVKNKLFGKSSEKKPSEVDRKKAKQTSGKKKKKVQLPSLRYPDAPLIEREVELQEIPGCKCCGHQMEDSGMTENAEFLTVVPAKFIVIRQKRHKYRCGKCHSSVVTAPAPPKIKPGSGFSDEMVVDVALSKFCDLIPVERYSAIAGRSGLSDLPPNSLIQQTHYLADFLIGAYKRLKIEILESKVLHADETPHRMLEGSDKKSWYLWGFSTTKTSYFEIRDTRSGDVASGLLIESKCEYLVSDVFSGYAKAVKETNKVRKKDKVPLIENIYCNAHARRKFKESEKNFPEVAKYYIELYEKIYRLEKIAQARPKNRILRVRKYMTKLFKEMKDHATLNIAGYSSKSSIGKAMKYFFKNYKELTKFIVNEVLPIDNNAQERQLRNPVIGRKTWYGTHSHRGALTTAIIFSLIESCKLNGVNPRVYVKKLVEKIHEGEKPFTPKEFKDLYD